MVHPYNKIQFSKIEKKIAYTGNNIDEFKVLGNSNLQWENLADTTLSKWLNLTSSVIKHTDFIYLLIGCNELFSPKMH